jgi:tetratricopeptide (TPR) repeat protein
MLVKAGRHSEAIGVYKHAIVVFLNKKHQNDDDADSKLTFAQCHLNMALCLLHLKTPANIIEAVICCDAAIELLQLPDQATWRAKAYYRKGQALELSGDLSAAVEAITSAAAASPDDEAIRQALAKLKEQQGQ